MAEVPVAVNTLVRLDFGGEVPLLASRVEDVADRDLLLSAAAQIGATVTPTPGSTLTVLWTGPRGVCSLPAEFRGVEKGSVRLWRVRAAGSIDVTQRRRFARVAAGGAISVQPTTAATDEASATVMGWMLNLSEGGVCLRAAPGTPDIGTRVRVRLSLDRELTEVEGEVLRLSAATGDFEEVVVAFTPAERQADRIRRYVMEEQLRQRRAGLS
jgi:hypothetical protein